MSKDLSLHSSDSGKWWIVVTIMTVAILEVLDSTIVNVALPNMMASLGANQNQITWILTSYVVASAIMLPLTGYISNRIGTKNMMLMNIAGFGICSAICGVTQGLPEMVTFRLLQGAFGAALIPLSQSILRQTFPPEEMGKAMAIWGLGIMTAPVLGPTLGGYITEHASWRWIFYMNIPICTAAFFMTMHFVKKIARKAVKLDFLGLVLMIIGVGCLQLMLDQGNEKSWFSSNFILLLAVLAGLGIILFIIRGLTHPNSAITMRIFKDRNFTICTILMTLFAGCLFAIVTVEPILLERLFNYPTVTTGLVMMPLGLASALGMVLSAGLMKKISIKVILGVGALSCAFSAYYFTGFSLQTSMPYFIRANALFGFGLGLFMVPLATYSLLTLQPKYVTEGAGLFSYGRMLGTSIGISLVSTLITQTSQKYWAYLSSKIQSFRPELQHWLSVQHLSAHSPKAMGHITEIIAKQANFQGYLNAFHAIAIVTIVLIPIILLLKQVDMSNVEITGGE